jgi:uncharacterized membrane protein YcaP (DUF421 family)
MLHSVLFGKTAIIRTNEKSVENQASWTRECCMKEVLLAILRGIFAYLLLLAVSRVIGRKAIARMTFFDYTISITLGSLAAYTAIGSTRTPFTVTVVILTFTALYLLTSALSTQSIRMRKLIDSEPVVVLAKGKLIRANMKKVRLTIAVLNKLLREKDVFNILDVEYAILESNGGLSVLLKSNKQPLTPNDMGVPTPYKGLSAEIIVDGMLLEENLAAAGKDAAWVKNELACKCISRVEDVFFAALDSSGNLYVSLGKASKEEPGRYGIE